MGAEQQYEVDSERSQAERGQPAATAPNPAPRHRGWVAAAIIFLASACVRHGLVRMDASPGAEIGSG